MCVYVFVREVSCHFEKTLEPMAAVNDENYPLLLCVSKYIFFNDSIKQCFTTRTLLLQETEKRQTLFGILSERVAA